MSKFRSIHTSPWRLSAVILCSAVIVLIPGSVNLVNSLPQKQTESSTVKIIEAGNLAKASTTTEKPIRHPNYVRLLKRTKNQNDTEEASSVLNVQPSTKATTTTTTTAKPKPKSSRNENDKIKSIIDSSQADQTEQPRTGLAGLFSFLTRPRLSLFGNSGDSSDSKINRNDRVKTGSSGKPSSSGSKNSTVTSTNSLLNPGSILASMMRALQGVTITFENMVMSFVNLFSFNGNRSGGGLRGLFSSFGRSANNTFGSGSGFRITPSVDGSSTSGFKIKPDLS